MAKKDKSSKKQETLYGSSIQPSIFEMEDGTTLQLGEVVLKAYEESYADTAEEWNGLGDEEREALIQAVIDKLPLKKSKEPEETKTEAPDLSGLVKMHKDGKTINAHPDIVKHHQGNGWELV